MLILAFDTTSEQGGVGLYRDAECLSSVPNDGPSNQYSVTLFQMIDRALAQAEPPKALRPLSFRDIELFAVATGPGSFTGIRVGVAAAQGWATALNRPVKGISVLEAMVEEAQPETEWAAPILDARRGEFFLGLFRRPPGQDSFQLAGEGAVLKPDALRSSLAELLSREPHGSALTCIVREQDQPARTLREGFANSMGWKALPGHLLGGIARLALCACKEGRLESPAELDACYIRRSDAELLFRKVEEQRARD